jgi:pimeloyl-ACP methyl ester carboxylesterase
VVLLHGFPQCWYQWRYVMPQLAGRFRVVAPDMRGFNESDKPEGIPSYDIVPLIADVAALVRELGEERAHIVGHDWGGGVAWALAMQRPDVVDRLAVVNCPHPATLWRELRNPNQLLRSWYILFFQMPLFPEALMRLTVRRSLPSSAAVPGSFPPEALDVYENALAQPGAATAMINYYRAAVRGAQRASGLMQTISRPSLLIWGLKDFALVPEHTEGLEPWVPDLRVERIEDSGHWVPEEKPRMLSDLLADFLA